MWSFYKALIKHPRSIGAAAPSSKKLARTIAQFIPLQPEGMVIELGPGTGVITKAMIQHGVAANNIIAIERSVGMTNVLTKKFPNSQIINGDAELLATYITNIDKPVTAIVSSLPLLSLPREKSIAILEQIEQALTPGGRFIQYTYGFSSRPFRQLQTVKLIDSKSVWFNIPPARVYVYERKAN